MKTKKNQQQSGIFWSKKANIYIFKSVLRVHKDRHDSKSGQLAKRSCFIACLIFFDENYH